jgi:hypothetical protein
MGRDGRLTQPIPPSLGGTWACRNISNPLARRPATEAPSSRTIGYHLEWAAMAA